MSSKHIKLTAVISFCTNDWRYLQRSISELKHFSDQILIIVSDHFFDGSIEDLAFLEELYRLYPDVTFLEYAFNPLEPFGRQHPLNAEDPQRIHHWHNTARLISYYFLLPDIDAILFLDADEIVDGERFTVWLHQFSNTYSAIRFSSYLYFREAHFQASRQADAALLVKRSKLTAELLLDEDERMGYFVRIQGPKKNGVLGLDGKPLFHHYSWVKTQEEMLKKCQTWAHHWERDWSRLIEEEYSQEFKGKDFIRGDHYQRVDPFFNPLAFNRPALHPVGLDAHIGNLIHFSHVRRVTAKDVFRLDLLDILYHV